MKVVNSNQVGKEVSMPELDREKMDPTRHTMRASKSDVSPPVTAKRRAWSLVLITALTPPIVGSLVVVG